MKIIVFIVMFTVLTGCNTKSGNLRDSVIFTAGPEINPSAPRVGIKITRDTLFYTEGYSAAPESFSYYYCLTDATKLEKVKDLVEKHLSNLKNDREVKDATNYQINIINKKIRFSSGSLNSEQYSVIEYILSLKNCSLIKIPYHAFPTEVLQEQLPAPSPIIDKRNEKQIMIN